VKSDLRKEGSNTWLTNICYQGYGLTRKLDFVVCSDSLAVHEVKQCRVQ
jgi:hypothetical protein